MKMDGIMKNLFNPQKFKVFISFIILVVLLKAGWFVVSFLWLPSSTISHITENGIKAPYYRVKLSPHKVAKPIVKAPPKVVKKAPPKVVKKPENMNNIQLIAIYNASDTTVVTLSYKKRVQVLGRGDKVNGFVLKSAGHDFAMFTKNSKSYKVSLKKKVLKKGLIKPVKPNTTGKDIKKKASIKPKKKEEIEEAITVVDRKMINYYAKNYKEIDKDIGIVGVRDPSMPGMMQGFKIRYVTAGSNFSKFGLKKNDIIKGINGQSFNSYAAAMNVYKNINTMKSMTLVIQRGNEEMELEYEIQ